ncbi:MAG: hypothetical protein ABF296_12735 [Oceanococcaceae bacterium]
MKIAEEIYSHSRGHGLRIDTRKARLARMRASIISGAECHEISTKSGGFRYRAFMVTLTYRRIDQWRPHHISEAIKRLSIWSRRNATKAKYVWVAELQKRGAVHYHVLVWLPFNLFMPHWDRAGWWPHGMTQTIKVKTNAVGYLVKYASKMANDEAAVQLKFPKHLRMHGTGGLSSLEAMQRRFRLAPAYVREHFSKWDHDVRRCPGGGWIARVTGEWIKSQWNMGSVELQFVTVWQEAVAFGYVDYREP